MKVIINIIRNKKYRYKLFIKFSEYKGYKIAFILSIYAIMYITYYKYIDSQLIESNNGKKFDKILPKINFNTSEIPSIVDIFRSRELFIGDSKLTKEYINYIRHKNLNNNHLLKNKTDRLLDNDLNFSKVRKNQLEINDYYELCLKEKFITNESFFNKTNNPVISVLVISYNKEDIILKSIRSIQNQSLKNIEIIIVNDNSTDKTEEILKQLLKTDERIRIFTHLKNMGAWRSRLDAFLYSNAPYVIHFDAGDFYSDNYVLEDVYYLANKFDIDSVRFGFRLTKKKNHLSKKDILYTFEKNDSKIIYGRRSYNVYGFRYGTIWNRLTKADVFTRGLYHLDEYILNSYKNIYEDRWWNTMANNESYTHLMTNRIGYIYLRDSKGQGHIIVPFINIKFIILNNLFRLLKYLLGSLLKMVVSQRLLPAANDKLVLVPEVMVVDNIVSGIIRKDKISVSEIEDAIQSGSSNGSIGLINSLAELFVDGKITLEQAKSQIEEKNLEVLNRTIMQLKIKRQAKVGEE